jgi:hypothetical protein
MGTFPISPVRRFASSELITLVGIFHALHGSMTRRQQHRSGSRFIQRVSGFFQFNLLKSVRHQKSRLAHL